MKKPPKFKSADEKRRYEENQKGWSDLKSKWGKDGGVKSALAKPDKPKGKAPVKIKIKLSGPDEVQRERIQEVRKLKSKVDSVKGAVANKRSIMDAMSLRKETPEVIEKTKAKSKALMPMYNKGPVQYITEDIDVKTIGSRSRRP